MSFKESLKSGLEWLEHGKTIVEILLALGIGKSLDALLAMLTHVPQAWRTPIWLLTAAIALLVIMKIWPQESVRKVAALQDGRPKLVPGIPTLSALQGTAPNITFKADDWFRMAYFSPLTAEVENNIKTVAESTRPNQEDFYARFIGVGLVAYMHDMTWAYILKNQL